MQERLLPNIRNVIGSEDTRGLHTEVEIEMFPVLMFLMVVREETLLMNFCGSAFANVPLRKK